MIIILVLAGMVLGGVAAGAIGGISIDRWLRENRQIEADIAEYEHRGKHAASSPRREPAERPEPKPEPERIVWERETGPVEVPRTYADWQRERMTRVVLPEPGTYPPQPGRDSGAGTITWPKIKLELGDTGEIRGIGDANVAAIQGAGT